MAKLLRSYAVNSSWVLAGNVLSRGLNLLALAVVARLLGPAAFGNYNLVVTSADSFGQMADLGTGVVIQRTYAGYQTATLSMVGDRFAGAVWMTVFFYAGLIGVLLSARQLGFDPAMPSVENGLTLLILISFTARLGQFLLVPLTGLQQFRRFSLRNVLSSVLTFAAVGIGSWRGGMVGALYGLLSANSLMLLITAYWLQQEHRRLGVVLRWRVGLGKIQDLLKQGFLLYMGNTLSGAVYNLVVVGLVIRFVPLAEYSYVRVGLTLASVIGVIVGALQPVTLSVLADNSVENQHVQLKSATIRILYCIVLLGGLWLIGFGNVLVSLLFGSAYAQAAIFTTTMLIITFVQIINQFYSNFLIAKGLGNFVGVVSLFTVALSTGLACWLIPVLGTWGYLISYSSGYITGLILTCGKEMSTTHYPDRIPVLSVFGFAFLLLFSAFLITRFPDLYSRGLLCLGLTALFGWGWFSFILHSPERAAVRLFIQTFLQH